MTPQQLAIVVVNYGSHQLLAANLPPDTVAAGNARVVVVDNFSGAAERVAIGGLCTERGWTLVPLETNVGFGAGLNAGVAAAVAQGCDVLLALNPDAIVPATVLRELTRACMDDPLALISPIIDTSEGAAYFRGSQVNLRTGQMRRGWHPTDGDPVWKNWLTGACLAFHRLAFERTGGLAEEYFLYWEDVEFSRRAAAAGVRLTLRTDLLVRHDEGGTQARPDDRAKSSLYYYYNARNRLLFARRQVPASQRWQWLLSTPGQSGLIWLRGGRRQLFTSPGGLVALVVGSFAGIRALVAAEPVVMGAADLTVLVAHPSPDLYGSDRVLLETVSAYREAGFRVVVALPAQGPLTAALHERGAEVEVCPSPVLRKSALKPLGMLRLGADALAGIGPARGLIRRYRPDFVFVNTLTIPLWLVVSRISRIPVVSHVHEAEKSASPLVRKALYLPLLLANRLVVNSRFSLEVLSASWPSLRERAAVVYNGVPGPAGEVVPPRSDASAPRLLFLGRLSPRKGPQVALAALQLLVDRGVDARLALLGAVFPGYEWFEAELRQRAGEADLAGRVEFLGFDPDIWQHLAESDIVLVPSTVDEPFGNTAVEAMLASRALVVSDTSGLREAASGYRTALQVEPDNPAAIADAVQRLLDSWGEVRVDAEFDRATALERHAPQAYWRNLVSFTRDSVIPLIRRR